MDDYAEALIAELKVHGVKSYDLSRNHNHPKLRFNWNGEEKTFIFPGTPSDRFGLLNSLTNLRRVMGVKRVIHKSSAPARKRSKPTTVTLSDLSSLTFTVKDNPFSALMEVADKVKQAVEDARWDGRLAYYAGLSGMSSQTCAPHLATAFLAGWYDGVWSAPV